MEMEMEISMQRGRRCIKESGNTLLHLHLGTGAWRVSEDALQKNIKWGWDEVQDPTNSLRRYRY